MVNKHAQLALHNLDQEALPCLLHLQDTARKHLVLII